MPGIKHDSRIAVIYPEASAAVHKDVFRRSAIDFDAAGGLHDGIQEESVHIAVAKGPDLNIFGDTAEENINIAIVTIVLFKQHGPRHIAAAFHTQHPALHIHIRRTGAGRNIHARIAGDCRIRDGSAAADKGAGPFANGNAVNTLTIVEVCSPPVFDLNVLQCNTADHAVRLEGKTIQFAPGLYIIDPCTLPFKHIGGISRFDEHIIKEQTSGDDLRFFYGESIQSAPLTHGRPLQGIRMMNDQIAAALDFHIMETDAGTRMKDSAVFHIYGIGGTGSVHFHRAGGLNRDVPY